jgi:hypothetical protein
MRHRRSSSSCRTPSAAASGTPPHGRERLRGGNGRPLLTSVVGLHLGPFLALPPRGTLEDMQPFRCLLALLRLWTSHGSIPSVLHQICSSPIPCARLPSRTTQRREARGRTCGRVSRTDRHQAASLRSSPFHAGCSANCELQRPCHAATSRLSFPSTSAAVLRPELVGVPRDRPRAETWSQVESPGGG